MKRAVVLVPYLLLLAACQPKAPEAKPAPDAEPPAPPAEGPPPGMDIRQPITARGNEPFWSVTIDGTHVRLTRPDQPEVAAETSGAVIQPGRATWVAMAPGQQITITVFESPCSDGMSDIRYPLTAEVTLINESLRGCAARTADLPKPPAAGT